MVVLVFFVARYSSDISSFSHQELKNKSAQN